MARRDSVAGRLRALGASAGPWERVGAVVTAGVLVRILLVGRPISADEGGFLVVASQWSAGSSVYGDLFVDRPPLLIGVFALADALGGITALRVLGMVVLVVSAALAARIARLLGASGPAAAAVTVLLLTTPLFGAQQVNGEQVALPFVLGGVLLVLQAAVATDGLRRQVLLVGAGAAAAAAVLVKQNLIDVLVVLLVGALTFLRDDRPHTTWRTCGPSAAGAIAMTLLVLTHAAGRGTGPLEVWDAVITFRLEAAGVISASAPDAVGGRLAVLLLALVGTGAPLFVVVMLRRWRSARPRVDVRWATAALLLWESVSVLLGGSYWLHYLVCLVPGLVLCVSLATAPTATATRVAGRGTRQRGVGRAVALSALSCLVSLGMVLAAPERDRDGYDETRVIAFLDKHARPGDTALVAFGDPQVLASTGLETPYPHLWSLPVRVRDPELVAMSRVLASEDRPDWLITRPGASMSSWAIDGSRARPLVALHYVRVADLGHRTVWTARRLPTDRATSRDRSPGSTR